MMIDTSVADKSSLSQRYDGFVCGSDQIWSVSLVTEMRNWFYFANFTNKPKIAYSPSLGASFIPNCKQDTYRRLLQGFKCISIREPQGQKAIQALLDMKVELTVDPTLLVGKQEWLKITPPVLKQIEGRYLLAYFLTSNDCYTKAVCQYAKRQKLKIVAFYQSSSCQQWADELICGGPTEFLSAIKNAEFVFTDSFHGSIFSVIFEKQFILFKRFLDSDGEQNQNSRIYHLMDMLGMPDKIIDENNTEYIDKMPRIDFDKVKASLSPYIESSKKYLTSALNEI